MAERATDLPIVKAPDSSRSTKRAGFVLGRRASLVVAAGVAGHTLWTSAAPALVYRLYAEEWHLSHTVTTGMFAVYPLAVVAMLVGFGGISDQIGRRAAMILGLCASLSGAVLFGFAPNVWWVFVGRALSGIGVGLSAGPSTAAILEFSLDQDAKRAASLSLLFVGGLQLISAAVPQHHRGGALSALYLVAYLSMAVVALVLGVVATARGLALAVDLGAAAITIMSIATFVLAVTARANVSKIEGTR